MPFSWYKNLEEKIINPQRIVILGVGSELRGDDSAGLTIVDALLKRTKRYPRFKEKILLFNCSTAPENYTSEIIRFQPSHLLIIDSASMSIKPGAVQVFSKENITGITFCTHVLPLTVMINYLNNTITFDTVIIGIQPKTTEFGENVTSAVNKSIMEVTDLLIQFLKKKL